eukprot:896880-Rhodomonas_salina.1
MKEQIIASREHIDFDEEDAIQLLPTAEEGYLNLQSYLCAAMPDRDVRLLTFVLGDRGLFHEKTWADNLTKLGLPKGKQHGFYNLAILGAYKVVEDILKLAPVRALPGSIALMELWAVSTTKCWGHLRAPGSLFYSMACRLHAWTSGLDGWGSELG